MKIQSFGRSALVGASVFVLAGCAGNPLVGKWTTAVSESGFVGQGEVTLNGDGSAVFKIQIAGGTVAGAPIICSGAGLTVMGHSWAATATQITLTGTSACTGMNTCTGAGVSINVGCAELLGPGMTQNPNGTNPYTLTNNNNTLTVTGSVWASGTYTRVP